MTVPRVTFDEDEQITDFNDLSDDKKHLLVTYMNGTLEADPDASAARLTDILIGAKCSATLMKQVTTMLTNIRKLYHAMRRENPREHVKDLLGAIVNTMKQWGIWRLGWRPNVKFDIGTGAPRDPGFFMLHAAQGVCFEMSTKFLVEPYQMSFDGTIDDEEFEKFDLRTYFPKHHYHWPNDTVKRMSRWLTRHMHRRRLFSTFWRIKRVDNWRVG